MRTHEGVCFCCGGGGRRRRLGGVVSDEKQPMRGEVAG